MTRVCIIGDSHLAALKLGWPKIAAEFPGVEMSFYGAPIAQIGGFAVADGRLIAESEMLEKFLRQTSGGEPAIDGSYALYLLCGMGTGLPRAADIFKRYLARMKRDPNTVKLSDLPDQKLVRYCAQALGETEAFRLLAKLRQITKAPVGMIGTPLPGPDKLAIVLGKVRKHLDETRLARIFMLGFYQAAKEARATFLDQPSETLAETPLATNPDFFRGAVRMVAEGEDQHHANAEYGAIVLKSALGEMWEFVTVNRR